MPDRRHHDPNIECKLFGKALLAEVPLEEHAKPLAEMSDRTGHAFLLEGKMRHGIEPQLRPCWRYTQFLPNLLAPRIHQFSL